VRAAGFVRRSKLGEYVLKALLMNQDLPNGARARYWSLVVPETGGNVRLSAIEYPRAPTSEERVA
jgi:hypothetical protein